MRERPLTLLAASTEPDPVPARRSMPIDEIEHDHTA